MNRMVVAVGTTITLALAGVLVVGLRTDPRKIESPLIGKPAPPFVLKKAGSGELVDLASLRGKPVVLNFWATWCRPCWDEHPTLTAASQQFGEQAAFLGVVFQDDEGRILEFLRQRGAAYPTVVDERGKTAIAYGVGGVPETFFLDGTGRIVAKVDGALTPEQLQANIQKVLGR
ncbi:MAG TPA: redoxin domain-containing protein [Thermoanaerobaculia bacterium]|nr:redoxin domain-containing protein [Thermoanaerobaculia bacterium]